MSEHWWKNTLYTRPIRFRRGLFGIPIPYRETTYRNYVVNRREASAQVVRIVKELQQLGHVPDLTRVLEPGCGPGSHLRYLHEAFDCQIYGFDISPKVIAMAEDKVLRRLPATLWVDDFVNTGVFDTLPEMDLILTVGFLQHIPITPQKKSQIWKMLQMTKAFVTIELFDEEMLGTSIENARGYCLAFDDYTTYGLCEYPTPSFEGERKKVFYRPVGDHA